MKEPISGETALNIAVKAIQDSLGVTDGSFAGMYFCGNDDWEYCKEMLDNYIEAEKEFKDA